MLRQRELKARGDFALNESRAAEAKKRREEEEERRRRASMGHDYTPEAKLSAKPSVSSTVKAAEDARKSRPDDSTPQRGEQA